MTTLRLNLDFDVSRYKQKFEPDKIYSEGVISGSLSGHNSKGIRVRYLCRER
jgi:hypothetical protein